MALRDRPGLIRTDRFVRWKLTINENTLCRFPQICLSLPIDRSDPMVNEFMIYSNRVLLNLFLTKIKEIYNFLVKIDAKIKKK